MRSRYLSRNKNYRWPEYTRNELLRSLSEGNEARFKYVLLEYFKWGSTQVQARQLAIPERTLRDFCKEHSNPGLKKLFKIFLSLSQNCKREVHFSPELRRISGGEFLQ